MGRWVILGKKAYHIAISFIGLGFMLLAFQNCQGDFASLSEDDSESDFFNAASLSYANSESFVGKKKEAMRVMTYNIQGGFADNNFTKSNLDTVAQLINEQEVDVVLLQEVDKNSRRAKGLYNSKQKPIHKQYHDQTKYLAGQLQFHYYFLGKPWQGGEYGLAILSRWPIDKVRSHEYKIDGYEKILLSAKINRPTYPVYVVNMHLVSGGIHLEENYKIVSQWLRQTFNDYDSRNYKIIIGGDFNTYEGMTIKYNKLKKKYQVKTLPKKKHGTHEDIGSAYYDEILNLLSKTSANRFVDPFYTCNDLKLDNKDNRFATKASSCKPASPKNVEAWNEYLKCKQEHEWYRRIDYLLYRGLKCSSYRVLSHMAPYSDHYPVLVDFSPTAKTMNDKE